MTGRILEIENKNFVLRNKKYLVLDVLTSKNFNNKTWVEFEIVDNNSCVVTKVYDENFGTSLENVSSAYFRYENNEYPINGFFLGSDTIICGKCEKQYVGSKKSKNCEPCGLKLEIKKIKT